MAFKELFEFGGIFDFVHRGERDLDKANRGVRDLEEGLLGAIKSVDVLGLSAAQAFALSGGLLAGAAATFAGLKSLSDTAIPLEEQIARVNTLLDAQGKIALSTEAQVSGLTRLSAAYGVESSRLGDALFQVVSAGVAADEALGFLEVSLAGARAGGADVFATVDGVTSVLDAMGLQAEDAGDKVAGATRVLDQFFIANKKGKTTVEQLSASIGRVAPLASALGLESGETLAALATLTKTAGSTGQAATQLSGALAKLVTPTEELKKAFGDDPLAGRTLIDFILDLQDKVGGNEALLGQMFGDKEAVLGLIGLTQGVEGFIDVLGEMEAATGAVDTAFQDVAGGAAFQSARLDEAVSSFAQTIGFELLPLRARVTGFFADLVGGARDFVDEHRGLVRAGLAVTTVLGTMAAVGGAAIGLLAAQAVLALPAVSAALYSVGVAAGTALAALLPFAPAVIAIGALGAFLAAQWEPFSARFSEEVTPALERFSEAWEGVGGPEIGLWESFDEVLGSIAGWLGEITGYVAALGIDIGAIIGEGIQQVGREFDAIGSFFSGIAGFGGPGGEVLAGGFGPPPAVAAAAGGGGSTTINQGAEAIVLNNTTVIDGRDVSASTQRIALNDAERRGQVPPSQSDAAIDGVVLSIQ